MDDGPSPIEDPAELNAVRRQASSVYIRSTVVAVVVTLTTLVL